MATLEEKLICAVENLNEDQAFEFMNQLIQKGCDFRSIERLLYTGLKKVGMHMEEGEYYLADLIMGGCLYKELIEKAQDQRPPQEGGRQEGTIVIGVMEGDIHDIGKNMVVQILKAEGFQIIDLGTDVKPEKFIQAVTRYQPDILALSGVMGFCVPKMRQTIELLEKRGLRDCVKVIVGGSCINMPLSQQIGADGYSDDPFDNVQLCSKLLKEKDR